jgi:hypothetical protein
MPGACVYVQLRTGARALHREIQFGQSVRDSWPVILAAREVVKHSVDGRTPLRQNTAEGIETLKYIES